MSPFLLSDAPQGSDEWRAARLGRATGSHAAEIQSKGKGNAEAVGRRNYRFQLVCERLTGQVAESTFSNRHMERGQEKEPYARMAHEAATGLLVREAGFAYLPDLMTGCSVDGFIDQAKRKGFGEYKCPIAPIHFATMQEDRVPPEHVPQINHNFLITGMEFCHFASFCDEFPPKLRLHLVVVERAEKAIKAYEEELLKFLADVDELERQLRERAA